MWCKCCGSRDEIVIVRRPDKKVDVYCAVCGNVIMTRKVKKGSEFYKKLEPFEIK